MNSMRNRHPLVALFFAAALFAATAAYGQPEPVWTGVGSTLTPDESNHPAGAVPKHVMTGGAFSISASVTTSVTISGRINVANPNDTGDAVRYGRLQVCYVDPDGPSTSAAVRVWVYRMGGYSCCSLTQVAYFNSNNFPALASCQSQEVAVSVPIFDFRTYTYYVYVEVYRSSHNYNPAFYSARLYTYFGGSSLPPQDSLEDGEAVEGEGDVGTLDGELGLESTSGLAAIASERLASGIRMVVPNPAQREAAIHYGLTQDGRVSLQIHDVQGRLVRNLLDESQAPGDHLVLWDGRDDHGTKQSNGVYYVHFTGPEGTGEAKKLILAQ